MPENKKFDWNMEAARVFAEGLGAALALPASLMDLEARAKLVQKIDGPFLAGGNDLEIVYNLGLRIAAIADLSREYLPAIEDGLTRANIALRLWAGCISAAKIIALETLSGPNTPEGRAQIIPQVEKLAAQDPIYAAGVEAAASFKRLRGDRYSFEGIPPGSLVLQDKNR
jgi:hypothetical protein